MRVYLVIMDETKEARAALRFASHRAAKTNGAVHILALVEPQDFVAFGGVQATIEEDRDRHGNPNVLTHDLRTSQLSQGSAAHSAMVDIRRFDGPVPPITAHDPPAFVGAPVANRNTD